MVMKKCGDDVDNGGDDVDNGGDVEGDGDTSTFSGWSWTTWRNYRGNISVRVFFQPGGNPLCPFIERVFEQHDGADEQCRACQDVDRSVQ